LENSRPLSAEPHYGGPVARATGVRRIVYVGLGTFFLALGVAGIFLPVLPTTPFLLLTSYFYLRSSPRLYAWLHRTRLFGPLLRDWEQHRAVRPRVKVTAVVVVLATVTASFLAGGVPPVAKAVLLVAAAIGLTVVVRLRTIPGGSSSRQPVAANAVAHRQPAA
jgi:uncharacterized membrane protein YbaN (DUF454 family)